MVMQSIQPLMFLPPLQFSLEYGLPEENIHLSPTVCIRQKPFSFLTSIAVILAGNEIGRQALFGEPGLPDVRIALPIAAVSFVTALGFGPTHFRLQWYL